MKPILALLALLALAACKEDTAALPPPVDLTAEAVGYYCQMDLLDHDGPKGQIHLDGMPAPIFFSQVRDTLAYLHMPEQSHAVRAVYVQDMTGATWDRPGPWIAADRAVYVAGSDRMGGMDAPEFVPFSDEAAARAFSDIHGGTLRPYADITAGELLATEPPAPGPAPDASDIAARLGALAQPDRSN